MAIKESKGWDGTGMPPVGCECEWQEKNSKQWIKVSIAYASEWVTVIREDKIADPVEIAIENYGDEARRQFRPIRSEADKKRDEAVAAMRNFATNYNNSTVIHAINQVYDAIAAGKVPGVRIE